MKYLLYILTFTIFAPLLTWGQNLSDVVRYSEQSLSGTARTMGVGGSFGAMGGDFSVININPAGLGEYAKAEFVISPSITSTSTQSFLKANPIGLSSNGRSSLKIDNMGFVIGRGRKQSNSWSSSNFAFGFNKIADFNRSFDFSGKTVGSITEEFVEYANGKLVDDLDDFRAWPAYRVGAIYDFDEDKDYESDFQNSAAMPVNKSQLVSQNGAVNELAFAWGGKYQNKLNLGFSLGIPIVNFEETKLYEEKDIDNEISQFENLGYTEYLNTSGAGINFKTGVIYDLEHRVRLGVAVHSPTWYVLNDDYFSNLTYAYNDGTPQRFEHRSPDGSFKYKINSPWKAVGSIGSIYSIGQDIHGFVNADIEWVDYGEASIDLTEYSSSAFEAQKTLSLEQEIEQFLGQSINLRLGTELGIKKLRLRAGAESVQSPFNADTQRQINKSFGIGLREDIFFLDVAVRIADNTQGYLPYTVIDKNRDPLVNIKTNQTKVLITAGFKF